MRQLKLVLFVFTVGLLFSSAAMAQTVTGTIDGHITDQAGAVIPGVQVAARNVQTGAERTTETNAAGYFQIPFVQLGEQELTAQMKGFATVVRKNILVTLNKTTTVDIAMKVSAVQESITVSEAAPLIDTASGQIRRSIEDTMADTLPSAGRSFLGFVSLFPGSKPTRPQARTTPHCPAAARFRLTAPGRGAPAS